MNIKVAGHVYHVEFEPDNHEYFVDGRRWTSVTQINSGNGFGDYSFLTPEKMKFVRKRGHFVHAAVKQHIDGVLDPATFERYPQVTGYIKAGIDWIEVEEFHPVITERIVLLPRLEVIGTIDAAGYFQRGQKRIFAKVDWKTCLPGTCPPETALQLAAYGEGLEQLDDYEFRNEPHERIAVELHRDGTNRPILYPMSEERVDRITFKAGVAMYRWKEKRGLLKEAV